MSDYKKRRRKLAAHDQGIDRHNKGVSFLNKLARIAKKKASEQPRKKRKA
jgi:hypothetical protein